MNSSKKNKEAVHTIRTGDHVYNRPSRETWVVAYVEDDGKHLAPCGWPFCLALVSDCELMKAVSDEESQQLIEELANMTTMNGHEDLRRSWARKKLGRT